MAARGRIQYTPAQYASEEYKAKYETEQVHLHLWKVVKEYIEHQPFFFKTFGRAEADAALKKCAWKRGGRCFLLRKPNPAMLDTLTRQASAARDHMGNFTTANIFYFFVLSLIQGNKTSHVLVKIMPSGVAAYLGREGPRIELKRVIGIHPLRFGNERAYDLREFLHELHMDMFVGVKNEKGQ